MNSGISLLKIVGGLSKTLNIVNDIIPIYKKVKPILGKSLNFLDNVSNNIKKIDTPSPTDKEKVTNSPTFFL